MPMSGALARQGVTRGDAAPDDRVLSHYHSSDIEGYEPEPRSNQETFFVFAAGLAIGWGLSVFLSKTKV